MNAFKTIMQILLVVSMIILQSGCIGTMMGMTIGHKDFSLFPPDTPDNRVYAGLRYDTSTMGDIVSGKAKKASPIAIPLLLIDLPVSFAADTILLPFTIPEAITNANKNKKTDEK